MPGSTSAILNLPGAGALLRYLLAVMLACAGMASSGAMVVLGADMLWGLSLDEGVAFRLWLKSLFFGLVVLGLAWMIRCFVRPHASVERDGASPPLHVNRTGRWVTITLLTIWGAFIACVHIDRYPAPEPDETHHLIVSRNIATHGVYGSGNPQKGFIRFDPYDSVGPTVLGPIAAVFEFCGVSLVAGRLVIALSFILLCVATYCFWEPHWGVVNAACGAVFMTGALGSVYLARTVYGETPALLFMVFALYAWDRALGLSKVSWWGVLAGLCLGLALMSKQVLIITAWAVMAALVVEYFSKHRLRVAAHAAVPMGVAMSLPLAWALATGGDAQGGGIRDVFGLYQHYLMFGFGGAPSTLAWSRGHLGMVLAIAVGLAWCVARADRMKESTAAWSLYIAVPFLLFWWCFFTPANIPRYTWYALAVGGACSGRMAADLLRMATRGGHKMHWRGMCAAGCVMLCLPFANQIRHETRAIMTRDDMASLRALAGYIDTLPADARIGVTFWPLERSLDFMCSRDIRRVPSSPDGYKMFDVVVGLRQDMGVAVKSVEFGEYAVAEAGHETRP